MKTTYKIILGFMILLFIGCGGENTTTPTKGTEQDVPKSPVVEDAAKVPPSIPAI